MQYDGLNRLTNTIFPDLSSARTIYNAIGKPAVTINQLGRQTFMDYDELGRVTRMTYPDGHSDTAAYDVEGRRIASTNRLGQVTQYNYDAVGRLFRMVASDGTSTTNYFDLVGQLRAATDARGFNTFYGYDNVGRSVSVTNALLQVSRSVYDEAGNLTLTIDALGRTNRFFYDALNRRTNTVFADGSTASTFFDELGRRIAETDQNTNSTRFGYDDLGRLRYVTNALGKVTEARYNELGQQTHQIDANHHATTFEHDSLGRRTKRTLPGLQMETYAYDTGGNLTNRTDFNGYITTFLYDVMNRLQAKVSDPRRGEPVVSFAYSPLGLRTNMTDASGVTAYRYDNRNRLIEKATPQGTLSYGYDPAGNVTNIQSSNLNGAAVNYGYDELNRLSTVNDLHVGSTGYSYDDVGNLRSYTLPNNVHSLYRYDALNRLTNLNSSRFITPVAEYAYTVATGGQRLTATETVTRNSISTTINRSYAYDATYRLLNETIGGLTPSPSTLGYNYDDVGNRLTLNSTQPFIPSATYNFDPNDRLASDTYDANGNTLFGLGFAMSQPDGYDFENRLTSRTQPGKSVTVVYDGDGNRVKKTVTTATNTITTWFLVDATNPTGYAQVLEEITSVNGGAAAVTRVYAYGHDLLSQDQLLNNVWNTSFYGYDGLGIVRYLTALNGDVTDTYDYDAFGNLIHVTGNTPNLYLYSGEQFDPDLNLYYLRARYHNPATGRFWSMDSFEGFGQDPASLHKYTYAHNDPINRFDPSGHMSLSELNFVLGITGTVINSLKAIDAFYHGDFKSGGVHLAFAALGVFGAAGSFPSGTAGALANGGSFALATSVQAQYLAATIGSVFGSALNIQQLIQIWTMNMSNSSGSQRNNSSSSDDSSSGGTYSGELVRVNKPDAAADALAEKLGGISRVRFGNDPTFREFDAVSDAFIGQAKPALQTIGQSFREQAKATFEAAKATGRSVYYEFKGGQPASDVVRKLEEYAERYQVNLVVDVVP